MGHLRIWLTSLTLLTLLLLGGCRGACCPDVCNPCEPDCGPPLAGVRFMGFSAQVNDNAVIKMKVIYHIVGGEIETRYYDVVDGYAKENDALTDVAGVEFHCCLFGGATHYVAFCSAGQLQNDKCATLMINSSCALASLDCATNSCPDSSTRTMEPCD